MSAQTVTVLLVEDDEVDVETVKRSFAKMKIANPVRVACDGIEGLETLRGQGSKPPLPRPYVVLLDLNMPRMNGIEFLQELRRDPDLHNAIVFVVTTSARDADRVAAYDLNVAGYILKSNAGEGFIEMIQMLEHHWRIVQFP
jgi:CheY-like chemotaxis protein